MYGDASSYDDHNDIDNDEDFASSLERARADLEIIRSCYPDEIVSSSPCDESSSFPFGFTLRLGNGDGEARARASHSGDLLALRLDEGYPFRSGVVVASYRTDRPENKARLEAVVRAVRGVSSECLGERMEGCIACCAAALETWNEWSDSTAAAAITTASTAGPCGGDGEDRGDGDGAPSGANPDANCDAGAAVPTRTRKHEWITGPPLFDRKSSFVAHVCEVRSERDVREALHQLLTSSSKIQRATHNMYAWRIAEPAPVAVGSPESDGAAVRGNEAQQQQQQQQQQEARTIIKHDNDDDGEDAAGGKLAFLLDVRKDENVLVVVSRWYGGIHLGPKRFAHIVNVARELLVEYTASRKSTTTTAAKTTSKGTSRATSVAKR